MNNIIYEVFNFKLINRITPLDISSRNANKIGSYHLYDDFIPNVRRTVIIDRFVGSILYINDADKKFKISNNMVGHRLGEFFDNSIHTKYQKIIKVKKK